MADFSTDRQIVERMLIPAMIGTLVRIVVDKFTDERDELVCQLEGVSGLLEEALAEPVKTLAPDRVAKLVRRSKRITKDALAPNYHREVAFQYLTIAFWTIELAERGVIAIGAESSFGRAWDMLASIMSSAWEDIEPFEDEARKTARMLGENLAALGYFRRDGLAAE
ncbi:MAG: hypothetical protein GC191_21000 [Azospirillum sp.]|nr:hypothetical protein [Azospirillum sp.]